MPAALHFDDDLARRLPSPLAQLYRRAHNAKSDLERHQAAYYLWEASLKLLAAAAVAEYAERPRPDAGLADCLQNLARPALGHWWQIARRLLPVLADQGDPAFAKARDLVLGRARDDLPRVAGLDAALLEQLEGRPAARSTVRLTELFDRLVRYRNRLPGHGAVGLHPPAFYQRMGQALLAGVPALLERLDVLAGRRLLYLAEVRRGPAGGWRADRYELRGEAPRRLEALDLPESEAGRRLLPERLYLDASPAGGDPDPGRLLPLHPLLVYDFDAAEVLFLNARRGKARAEYLSYSSGKVVERADLAGEQRELLARVLELPADAVPAEQWAARSQAEEGPAEPTAAAPRRLGEFELLSELGRGGMGVVYRAWQPSLGRQVALKKLFQVGDPRAEARFAREIRALGRVEHPHLVKIFTSGSDGEQWFYAMELIEGVPLAAVCDRLQAQQSSASDLDVPTWQRALSTAWAEARKAEKPLSDAPSDAQGGGEPAAPQDTPRDADAPRPPGRDYVRLVVELGRQVAEAAHALHERGILHRDVKPGNILVTTGGGQAVLMDLGLAQIADEVEGRLTKTRQFVGTLRYASPEQVLAVGGLDRRSDVYNLGATLWELLTLRPLFGATEQTPTPELMRRIQYEEPERPRRHHPGLSRDLEAVVLKCLEKDAGRRYATAHELARDLERYQAGEPVRARPVGRLQRGWRWCRRNPAWASMLALLIGVIVGSLAGLTVLYLNAERQRQVAEHREAGARAVTKFYEEHVLAAARPAGWGGGAGKDVTLKAALDQAGPKIDAAFAGQPELEATVRDTLGMTYWYLGEFEAASPHLEKAFALRRERLGPNHPGTLTSQHNLAMLRWKQHKLTEAIALARQALERRRQVLGPEHPETLWTQLNLGLFLSEDGQKGEAEALLRAAIESCKRTLGPDHHHTLYGQNDLAIVLGNQGKYKEQVSLNRETLEGRRRSLGPEHPDTLRSVGNLAYSLQNVNQFEEAELLQRLSLEARLRVLGEGHEETLWSQRGLADALKLQGKWEEASQFYHQVVESSKRNLGPEHRLTLKRQYFQAWLLDDHRRPKEAEDIYRRTLAGQLRVLRPEHPDTLFTQNNLAVLLSREGKKADAEALYREILKTRRRLRGPDHPAALFVQNNLAIVLQQQGKWAEAEQLFRTSLEAHRRSHGPDNPATLKTQNYLANLLGEEGKLAEAEKLYRQTLEARLRLLGPENVDTLWSRNNLAWVLDEQGKVDEAEALYRQTLETRRRVLGPENPDTLWSQNELGVALRDWGRLEEAERVYRDTLEIRRHRSGPEHPDTLLSQSNLALVFQDQGRFDEAETLLCQTLEIERRIRGPEHPDTLTTQAHLADVLGDQGKVDEAVTLFQGVLASQRKTLLPDHLHLAGTLADFGYQLASNGRAAEAEPLLREGLMIREKKLPAENWRVANVRSVLGCCLARQKKFADAEQCLLVGAKGVTRENGAPVKQVTRALDRVIELYEKWGKPEQAAEWRNKRPAAQKSNDLQGAGGSSAVPMGIGAYVARSPSTR